VLIACGASVIWKAMKNFDPCNDPTLGGDCYYSRYDSAFAAAQQNYQANIDAESVAPVQNVESVQVENQDLTLSTNIILCAPVKSGGSVSQAVQDANNGIWPPYELNGQEMLISIDHNGRIIRTLKDEIHISDMVNPGDIVCISTNRSLLESH
jgi:hypothetical protein